jgi:hypothetical protein
MTEHRLGSPETSSSFPKEPSAPCYSDERNYQHLSIKRRQVSKSAADIFITTLERIRRQGRVFQKLPPARPWALSHGGKIKASEWFCGNGARAPQLTDPQQSALRENF